MERDFFEPNQPNQEVVLTDCGIANAMYGLSAGGTTSPRYMLANCRFEQNLYGVFDGAYHYTDGSTPGSVIAGCTFVSVPNLLYPNRTATGIDSWSYAALYLIPSGNDDGRPKVEIKGTTTITGAIYGLIANQPGQALVQHDGTTFNISRIVRTAIWLDVMKESLALLDTHVNINFNTTPVFIRSYQAMGTSPGEPMYGLVVTNNTGPTNKYFLSVEGGSGISGDTANYRTQTGVLVDNLQQRLERMTLTNLTFGASLRAGSALITDNTFANCFQGLRIRPNASATVNFDISCNSFAASSSGASSGVYIAPQAVLNNQGSPTYPVGNKFQGYGTVLFPGTRSLVNAGSNGLIKYYRFSTSVDEEITSINDGNMSNPQPAGSERLRQVSLNVKAVPVGQYAATVLPNGVPSATHKVVINH